MEPTKAQQDIIEYEGNTVVLASPGSGKTFVLSEMIKRQLTKEEMLAYQGVIAISYTRKASAHLKRKSLADGVEEKNSFFGTIDSFCLSQIINKFGAYVFGYPTVEVAPIGLRGLEEDSQAAFEWIDDEHPDYDDVSSDRWDGLYALFCEGLVLIEALELMALRIVNESIACRNYIKARFTHVFIDEYQDADTYTNGIFEKFVELGLTGIVVGDKNQSIFGFAHKHSRYLEALSKDVRFKAFPLLDNFRCSQPIIDYSSRLLDANYQVNGTAGEGVYHYTVTGGEDDVASWLSKAIPMVCKGMKIDDYSQVAILVKKGTMQTQMDQSLSIPHRLVETTILDRDMNPRSRLYGKLLEFFFNKKMSFFEVIDEFEDYESLTLSERKRLMSLKDRIREVEEYEMVKKLPKLFARVANILLPQYAESYALQHLDTVMNDETLLNTYRPLKKEEVVLMTLHKSKGLEFDVVFHLNMNEWEMPGKLPGPNGDFDHPMYVNYNQDLDLHYVGITRARKVCFLVSSSQRTNSRGRLSNAYPSEFLGVNGLEQLRTNI
jgi:DNA helicase-2/ATP-dependent DNA helicase PcrA